MNFIFTSEISSFPFFLGGGLTGESPWRCLLIVIPDINPEGPCLVFTRIFQGGPFKGVDIMFCVIAFHIIGLKIIISEIR